MTEAQKYKYGGIALMVAGVGLILFGGTKQRNGLYFEIFGITFGSGESEPMSKLESWFWGVALIVGGYFVHKAGQ